MASVHISLIHELAIRSGNHSAVEVIERKLSLPEARDKHGNTLLMLAIKHRKVELVEYFYERGVPVEAVNFEQKSALDMALEIGESEIATKLRQFKNPEVAEPVAVDSAYQLEAMEQVGCEASGDENLNGWEGEALTTKPKHDEQVVTLVAAQINILQSHRPVNEDVSWDDVHLVLPPAVSRQKTDYDLSAPYIFNLLSSASALSYPISERLFLDAVDRDQFNFEEQLTDDDWIRFLDTLGFTLEESSSAELFSADESVFDEGELPSEFQEQFEDALGELRSLSQLWQQRIFQQASTRDVLSRLDEERISQRMDSSLIAIRKLIREGGNIEYLCALSEKAGIAEFLPVDVEDVDDNEAEDELEEKQSEDAGLAFINYVLSEAVDENQSPPRPSAEEYLILKSMPVGLIGSEFLNKLEMHYQRYIAARNTFFESNLRLSISIAKKFRVSRHRSYEDNLQSGFIGLLKAVEKFDYRQGFKFSTYASWWIRQRITRDIADEYRTIRWPVHVYQSMRKLERAKDAVAKRGDPISPERLAAELGFTPSITLKLLGYEQVYIPLSELDESFLGGGNAITADPLELLCAVDRQQSIRNALAHLNAKERQIIERRFGLYENNSETLEEVGKYFNVTRERIRQIEAKALRRMSQPSFTSYFEGEKMKDRFDAARRLREQQILMDSSEEL